MVVDGAPAMFDHVLGPSLLDAMIIAATEKAPDDILEDDYLEIITSLQLEPRIIYPERLQAHQPLRLRHPSAVAGVLQERQADRAALARVAAGVHGHAWRR